MIHLNHLLYKVVKKNNHIITVDNQKYSIPISYYYDFLKLNNYKIDNYHGIPIEYFVYGLVSYFDKKNNLLDKELLNRYLDLKKYQIIDYEMVNRCLKTNDKRLSKVVLSQDVRKIIFKKYDDDILKNIIKVYIELCKKFTYDDLYYIDYMRDEVRDKSRISSIYNIDNKNNKVVCFQWTEIFGYFLNSLNINYEIIGDQKYYGYVHTCLIFRYGKYLIKVNPIKSIFKCDFTNTKVNLPLIGIECINNNHKTKLEFQKILNNCYTASPINYDDDYLPFNKIENDIQVRGLMKDYIRKIDLIIKKISPLDIVDKISYFNILMYHFFEDSIDRNISYSFIHNYVNIAYVIALNEINVKNDDNIYLVYYKNKLMFYSKEELENLFINDYFKYLDKRHLPNINISK